MKIFIRVSLIVLLFSLNGCMTSKLVYKGIRGYTDEKIDPAQVGKGDRVRYVDRDDGVAYIQIFPRGKDNSNLPVPTLPPYYMIGICKPHPSCYALLPLSVAGDAATLPFQLVYFMFEAPVSH